MSGAGGHNACFAAACVLVKGFDLSEVVALGVLREEFNPKCAPAWSEKELLHKIRQAGNSKGETGYLLQQGERGRDAVWKPRDDSATAARAGEAMKKEQALDAAAVEGFSLRGARIDELWLAERSPVEVGKVAGPEELLGHLYRPGEKVLVFTKENSQGDFGFEVRDEDRWPGRVFRLGARPNVPAERAELLPRTGRLGVWFLASPVDGEWKPNGSLDDKRRPIVSRRSGPNVTAWRYLLLESDKVEANKWLEVVVQLPLPIAAMYTSGGRSVHALLRLEARTQDEMRAISEVLGPLLSKLGGDAKAMSSVRLTRLPGCFREGKMVEREGGKKYYERFSSPVLQRLLWLDPMAEPEAILTRPKIRTIE